MSTRARFKQGRYAFLDVVIAVLLVMWETRRTLRDLHLRADQFAASDLKTLFASAWSMRHGLNAYSLESIRQVFVANDVVLPHTWFGHAPVYPPTTLVLLLPFVGILMRHAIRLMILLMAVPLALAAADLMRYGYRSFGLGLGWRLLIPWLIVVSPLLRFALSFGNLSVPTAALSVLAFTRRRKNNLWLTGGALALALLLKPHVALWVAIAMLLLPEKEARGTAVRGIGLAAALSVLVLVGMAVAGQLGMQLHAYRQILAFETAAGASMSGASHDVLELTAQITSFKSLVGFWRVPGPAWNGLCYLLLLGLAAATAVGTLRARRESTALLAVAAWSAFGLAATYHRAHDAIVLMLLLPWCFAVGRHLNGWAGWWVAALLVGLNLGPGFVLVHRWSGEGMARTLRAFLVMRQGAVVDLLLLLTLLVMLLWREPWASEDRTEEARLGEMRSPASAF